MITKEKTRGCVPYPQSLGRSFGVALLLLPPSPVVTGCPLKSGEERQPDIRCGGCTATGALGVRRRRAPSGTAAGRRFESARLHHVTKVLRAKAGRIMR